MSAIECPACGSLDVRPYPDMRSWCRDCGAIWRENSRTVNADALRRRAEEAEREVERLLTLLGICGNCRHWNDVGDFCAVEDCDASKIWKDSCDKWEAKEGAE